MALIQCRECEKQISSMASSCPHCGAPAEKPDAAPSGRQPYSAQEVAVMLSKKKSTSHLLHLILSVLTIGAWVIVWVIVAISNSIENSRIDMKISAGKRA